MRWTRVCTNFLLVFYLFTIYFSGMPDTNTLNFRLKQVMTDVANVLGIWPSWSMFAPNPIKFDSKTYAILTFRDGSMIEEDVEPELSGPSGTLRRARWMKFSQDSLRGMGQKRLFHPLAQHLRWKHRRAPSSLVKVELLRRWNVIHPFSDQELFPIDSTPRDSQEEILYKLVTEAE